MGKFEAKEKFKNLIEKYNNTLRHTPRSDISEETIRTWLNEMLFIFGWDVQNTSQVLQEHTLRGMQRQRLQKIHSSHRKPDYILLNGVNIKTFLDAKSLDVDIFSDREAAFQIRSYGWSAQSPCAFVSNFEQFVIYDTRFVPDPKQDANMGTIQLSVDLYLDNFDLIYDHLYRNGVCANHLEDLYKTTAVEGKNRVDSQFMGILTVFRRKLAENIYEKNSSLITSDEALNYYVQVILDRIVFIRVCESKEIEEREKLRTFTLASNGFWDNFRNSCYMEFYNHYDGAMFCRDEVFQRLSLDDDVLNDFIDKLYYPYPYRFDVIPVKVLANIYEEFLGKQLVITEEDKIKEVTKDEYIRTNGAITTPEHIVEMVCKQTISLDEIKSITDLFQTTVLDPCCGSGVFVVACYELIAAKMVKMLENSDSERQTYPDLFYENEGQIYLTVKGRRRIMTKCIFAIDCDEAAIEVTKMSLALKIVDGNNPVILDGLGVYGDKILREISDNIKLGNTLVDVDNHFSGIQILEIKPFNIQNAFRTVFHNGGFCYIVGNPPYVETKYYKAAQPAMHDYLSKEYSSFEGKADLAVLFIERCLNLIKNGGKIGFIIQRRWFKTVYGGPTRMLINNGGYLEKLIDFKAINIFEKRIVYASIMVLSKTANDGVQYYCMPSTADEIKTKFENSDQSGNFAGLRFSTIPHQEGNVTWAYDSYAITQIKNKLAKNSGTLSEYPHLLIKDGIQALWKKMYHFKGVLFKNGLATGVNGFDEVITLEEDVLRGVIYNRVFYPFKDVQPDAYCLFPYEGASAEAIPYHEFQSRFPLTYNYLESNKSRIQKNVACRDGELWHTFTREHNQNMYYADKIIIPMTAKDTIATYVRGRGLYMDNANVWFISVPGANVETYKAITCVINSTVFSVLGKAGANPQTGGYYKFNKQFLAPIPFPIHEIEKGDSKIKELSSLYDAISDLQNKYLTSTPIRREFIIDSLAKYWKDLDIICEDLYGLNDDERKIIRAEGRTISRIALMDGANS